jgi:phage-related protein
MNEAEIRAELIVRLTELQFRLVYRAMKPVRFVGDTLQAIRNFPVAAKNKVGYQLERVRRGRSAGLEADKIHRRGRSVIPCA